ncbi:MAG: outer membrane protein assembly factor BamB [Verrucomicrobiales bacterium]
MVLYRADACKNVTDCNRSASFPVMRKFDATFFQWVIAAAVGIALFDTSANAEGEARWTHWRGANMQGHADATITGLPETWSETENVAWKSLLPGRGWSSPVVWGKQVWMTAAIEVEASEEEAKKRLQANTSGQPLTLLDEVTFLALCVDAETGELLHNIPLMVEKHPQWVHKLNSYASPTPVIEEGRLYCHFGTFGTVCVDTRNAKVLWSNRTLNLMHENGPGSSPILWKDKVIFHGDGSDLQFIAALDKATGKLAWKTDRSGKMNDNPQLKKAYATPVIVDYPSGAQLISPAADWLYSYDLETGKELWKLNYETLGFSNVAPPVVSDGMIFVTTGFMKSELLAVAYDGTTAAKIAWRYKRNVPTTPAPILVDGDLYFASDQGGLVTCLDSKTGDRHYRERIASGNYSAAPVYADGKLYFFSREGEATVLKPGKDFTVVAKANLNGQILATPAIVPGALLLRTDKALYRLVSK